MVGILKHTDTKTYRYGGRLVIDHGDSTIARRIYLGSDLKTMPLYDSLVML